MKTLLISTALFTAPLVGSVTAQTPTGTLAQLVSEQDRQIQDLKTEIASLRSLLNLERSKNGKASSPVVNKETASKPISSTTSYTVKAGDTFSSISRKHGISVSALIAANPTVKPSKLAINHKLVIPQMNTKSVTPVAKTPEKASLTNSNTQTISTNSSETYKVAKGDSFYGIAKKHKISISSLSAANPGVNPNKLKIGQTIRLSKRATTKTASSPSTQKATTNASGTYKITKGDTFYGIAKKHKMSLAALSAANPGLNPNQLKIGQTIRISKSAKTSTPTKSTSTSNKPSNPYTTLPKVEQKKTTTPAKPKVVVKSTPKPTTAPKNEAYIEQSTNIARTVPVSHEMTFGAFASKHGTTISVLNALNGLDLPADEPMAAGSELFIPNK